MLHDYPGSGGVWKMIEIRGPIRYVIDASEQEDGTWGLNYREYFTETDWNDARKYSTELFAKMKGFMAVEMNDEKRMATITMSGSKDKIMNMLAAEFLGFSGLGEMSLKDLFGVFTMKLAQASAFETINDEEPKIEEDLKRLETANG